MFSDLSNNVAAAATLPSELYARQGIVCNVFSSGQFHPPKHPSVRVSVEQNVGGEKLRIIETVLVGTLYALDVECRYT